MKHFLPAIFSLTVSLLYVCGCASPPSGHVAGLATVRAVHGDVQFTISGKNPQALHVNMKLPAGAKITTAPDSTADLQVNGRTSTIRVTESTVVIFTEMETVGSDRNADSFTELRVIRGRILGSVRKITANSKYEIITPDATARIRGTDFSIAYLTDADGKTHSIFISVTGEVVVTAQVGSVLVTKVLNTSDQWTPGEGDVTRAKHGELFVGSFVADPQLLSVLPAKPMVPSPPPMIQPFNGNGPPNPARVSPVAPIIVRPPPDPGIHH